MLTLPDNPEYPFHLKILSLNSSEKFLWPWKMTFDKFWELGWGYLWGPLFCPLHHPLPLCGPCEEMLWRKWGEKVGVYIIWFIFLIDWWLPWGIKLSGTSWLLCPWVQQPPVTHYKALQQRNRGTWVLRWDALLRDLQLCSEVLDELRGGQRDMGWGNSNACHRLSLLSLQYLQPNITRLTYPWAKFFCPFSFHSLYWNHIFWPSSSRNLTSSMECSKSHLLLSACSWDFALDSLSDLTPPGFIL